MTDDSYTFDPHDHDHEDEDILNAAQDERLASFTDRELAIELAKRSTTRGGTGVFLFQVLDEPPHRGLKTVSMITGNRLKTLGLVSLLAFRLKAEYFGLGTSIDDDAD